MIFKVLSGPFRVHPIDFSMLTTSPPMIEQKWEILFKQKMLIDNKIPRNLSVNIKVLKVLIRTDFLLQLRNELKGTSRGRAQPNTGRGGAPKFFLNWLTFAL